MAFWKGKNFSQIDIDNLPKHIGIILDGNGRWAKKRGLPRSAGHAAGSRNLKAITRACGELGIEVLTVYAFSTENWNRPKSEVNALMKLLLEYMQNAEREIGDQNVVIKVIGDVSAFTEELQKEIVRVEKLTADNGGLLLNISLNYGGRQEIVKAVKTLAEQVKSGDLRVEDINEQMISDNIYTAGLPEADLIIRPSGEYRLSNFLLWQSAYSELWFSNILWPDFSTKDLKQAIIDYQQRNRRYGGV